MPSIGPTSALCLAQEASLTALASSTNLPQVRMSALSSAAAWKKQSVEALSRERREVERLDRTKQAQAVLLSDYTVV
jgi:hypothetical protein